MDQIFSDLEKNIEKLFTKDDLVALNDFVKNNPAPSINFDRDLIFLKGCKYFKYDKSTENDNSLFLPTSKLLMLIFRIKAHSIDAAATPVVDDINAPVLDGMYPLHLALLTPCTHLVDHLIVKCGANPNVKCSDANSPFYGMTPLEMALNLMSKLISWTPQLPLHHLVFSFHDKKPKLLFQHIRTLVLNSVGVRDLISDLSQDVKHIELAALLLAASDDDNSLCTMYIPTTRIPPQHHFGVPMMLRLLVASRISSLIKEEVHLKLTSAQEDSDDAYQNHKKQMLDLTTNLILLESADRGELLRAFHWGELPTFDEKHKDSNKDKDANMDKDGNNDITKESQDELWVNRHLNSRLFYTNPALCQPCGIFDSLMPRGYGDSFGDYDGLDINNNNSLTETIFRELNGRKIEDLSFKDSCLFRSKLKHCLLAKAKEESKLTALELERSREVTEENKRLILKMSSRSPRSHMNNRTFHTLRTLSAAASLATGVPVYSSGKRNSVLLGRKMSWLIGGYDDDCPRKTRCCADRMQNKCIEDWSSFASEELSQIRVIIENDRAVEFESFLDESEIQNVEDVEDVEDVLLAFNGCELCPYDILGKICHHRALNCAYALLSHKVGKMMNLNIQNCHGSYPLHDAAITLSYSLVKLLLQRGARIETGTWDPVPSLNISPLDYAVERFSCDRNLINWSPKKSAFKLIITLCLPQMKEARDTIALLAGVATTSSILTDAIFNAVKRGQVVPVAALLLVAREKVMGLSFFGNEVSSGSLEFPKAIMNELATLVNQEYALMGREEHSEILQLCLEKKELMIYFLQLIEIFERAGPDLDSYMDKMKFVVAVPNKKVSNDVTKLLQNARFTLSTNDTDISDLTSSLKPDRVPSDIELEQQVDKDDSNDIWFKAVRKQLCRCDVKNSSCTTSKVFHRIVGQSFIHGQRRLFSSNAGQSAHASWTIPPRDISFLPCSPKVFGRVEPRDKNGTTVKESSKLLQVQVSKRVVRSVSVLLAALKRRGVRAV